MDFYSRRKYIISVIIILVCVIFIIRLFIFQVVDTSYQLTANNNVLHYVIQYPARGLIFDRNGELIVYNEAAYDLMVDPRQLAEFDTLDFCNILNITKDQVDLKIKNARAYSNYKPSIFLKQISSKTYAVLQEKLYKFPGFFVQTRMLRKYPKNIAAHVLGYVGEVDEEKMKNDKYYSLGDYIGISGIEKSYEKVLRGKKGVSIFFVDVHNRIKGPYQSGRYDTALVVGSNITITIDAELQEYGETLMQNKTGSIVALEPFTGEVLSLVSTPTYKPELFVGRIRTSNYKKLMDDTLKPLFNRALMAKYPPGSTFKLIHTLIALQEHTIFKNTEYYCSGGYYAGGIFVNCHNHYAPLNLPGAIQNSCNTYFSILFRNIIEDKNFEFISQSFNNWRNHVLLFGFGKKLDSDFTNELPGIIPTYEYYDEVYGKNKWNFFTIRSLAIGQGELGTTPLQMANMVAAIANRGYYYTPHIIKKIQEQNSIEPKFTERHNTTIDSSNFEIVIEGMYLAVNGGAGSTAWRAKVNNISICGKTGTAENPHGEDHSIFVAFAPRENPQIAIAVYIENGGFGNLWAAPIASLMIEKYLNDSISRPWIENYVLNADFPGNQ